MSERLIPYQPMDLAEPAVLVEAIRKRRGGQFINLDRMLLHSIPIAEGWNHFVGEIRNNLSLDPKLRELAMCGVAILNGAEYEFFHHAPPFIKAGGTEEQVQALRLIGQPSFPSALFSAIENDAVELTFQMTRNIQVEGTLMKRLQAALGNTNAVELVTVVAAYNMVSRFLIALDVNPEEHPPE
jgi:alkylhydroperoxidase family enzyme